MPVYILYYNLAYEPMAHVSKFCRIDICYEENEWAASV